MELILILVGLFVGIPFIVWLFGKLIDPKDTWFWKDKGPE